MKILVIQDHLRSGGTERQSVLLARAFRDAGHHVRLLTFRPGGALSSTLGNLPHQCLQPFDTGLDWFAPLLGRAIRSFEPEVILCMGRMANSYGTAIQGHAPAAAVIATMRTGKRLPWLFRRSLRRVTHIVANSAEAMSTLVNRHSIDPQRITAIRNSLVFSEPAAKDTGSALRAAHDATPDTTVLLSVAMFRPEKNQRELIETVSDLPHGLDWQLWLAGEGPTLAACKRIASRQGPADRIKFLGWHRDPAPLYAAADIAVHASASESLSNFLIEAQAQGLPCVAFDAQGISECFIPDDTGCVIPREEYEAFVNAILRFAGQDPAEHAALATRARAFARERFDPGRQARSFLDLFARVAKVKTPPPSR